jgi:type IV pili sensor histidine kinase/response regulator
MEQDTLDLFALPLPDAHRSLGPMPLQTALETLTGPAFRLVEDPVHRLLTFERCHSIESTGSSIPHLEAR